MQEDADFDFSQEPFSEVEFIENPEPRCPVLLLLDVSGSMSGKPIQELNEGIKEFKSQLMQDSLASKRVEIAIIAFSNRCNVVQDFNTIDMFFPEDLTASGVTCLGEAIETGLDILRKRKNIIRSNGIKIFRPWVFLITDGAPTDNCTKAVDMVHTGESGKEFMFYAVGVAGADMTFLKKLSVREPLKLKGLQFTELFKWLSSSLSSVSQSNPGDSLSLPPATGPQGWGTIES